MKVISAAELNDAPALYNHIANVLAGDGIVCFPSGSSYRLAANLLSESAVLRLMQSKRRSGHHPALILVGDEGMLSPVVGRVPRLARRLIDAFWPGPLTLVLDINPELPPKIVKTLTRATGKVGVRCPGQSIAAGIVRAAGRPLLVSSANMANKTGAQSVAQIRKNFQGRIDLWIDAGDLQPYAPSTLVSIDDHSWHIVREGAVGRGAIEAVLRDATPPAGPATA